MFTNADERRHPDAAVEAWWWWAHSPAADVGLFVGLEVRGRRFDYWAGLVRVGEPYLYVEELDGTGLRDGLEIKPPQMWAGHQCDVPFRQWSLGNEAHGVLVDHPLDVLDRPFGTPAPVTFDIEWYAAGEATDLTGVAGFEGVANGYEQSGEVDAQIELLEGVLSFEGPAHRLHVWGAPHLPRSLAMPIGESVLQAPHRRSDARHVTQVLTRTGWLARTVDPA